MLTFPGARADVLFQWLLVVGLCIFVGLQGWLVWLGVRMLRSGGDHTSQFMQEFGLRLGPETFWTALPLLMTIGLALVSVQAWKALTPF